jgi:hypothetical protein
MNPANASGGKEPATSIGQKFAQFYRAHRPEVLGLGGIAVAGLAYYRSKHPSSASAATTATDTSTTASGIDPATGVPYATELAEAQSATAADGGVTAPGGGEGSTGYSGGGYDGSGGDGSDILSALTGIQTTLNNGIQVTGDIPGTINGGPIPSQTNNSPQATTGAASRTPAENLANLDAELAKDKKINTPAAKSSVATLNKQITAVKARS